MNLFIDRYQDKIDGILSCFDRVVIKGTLPQFCYARGLTDYLNLNNIRIFDYTKFAEPLRDEIRCNAEKIAKENGLEIEFIRKNNFRKEKVIKDILKIRGDHPGMVHIFSAMEACNSYKPWHDKKTHNTFLKPTSSKCLHYYFYFIDEMLGLCYIRVPTWCPFQLQIYFNGHNLLANQLKQKGIDFKMIENGFVSLSDYESAQALSNDFSAAMLHEKIDLFAEKYCPIIKKFFLTYHWSIMQVEYSMDLIFKRQKDLKPIYENLTRTAIHAVKPEHIATFLGRKLHENYQDEMGNNFNTRIEGTRIKHSMGKVSIKMYDKFSLILRIEVTVNDVSFFKHFRKVEHRDGTSSMKLAAMKKSIYSLGPLSEILGRVINRYLEFISAIDDKSNGIKNFEKISKNIIKKNRNYKGFNLLAEDEQELFYALAKGEFSIKGFQNKNIREKLPGKTCSQVSRLIKRLRMHGLVKKIPRSFRYHLTKLGNKIVILGLKLKEMIIIPELA